MTFLFEKQLKRLNTKRLLALYKSIRSAVIWNGHWELEYMTQVVKYRDLIKEILGTRGHVK